MILSESSGDPKVQKWNGQNLKHRRHRNLQWLRKNLWPNFNWWLAQSLKALVRWCRVPEMGILFPRKLAICGAWPTPTQSQQACHHTPTTHQCRYSRPLHLLNKALMQDVAHHQKATLIVVLQMPICITDNCREISLKVSLWLYKIALWRLRMLDWKIATQFPKTKGTVLAIFKPTIWRNICLKLTHSSSDGVLSWAPM